MIGVIGLGGMGSGIAGTLLRNGNAIAVYDLDASRLQSLLPKARKRSGMWRASVRAATPSC